MVEHDVSAREHLSSYRPGPHPPLPEPDLFLEPPGASPRRNELQPRPTERQIMRTRPLQSRPNQALVLAAFLVALLGAGCSSSKPPNSPYGGGSGGGGGHAGPIS